MRAGLVALAAGGVFLLSAVRHLDVVPRVFEDEPWQASTAAKLAAHAVFGTDLFAGYFHMEQRYYDFLPLNPILEAAVFKLAGVGLLQARLESVAATLLTLALTWWLGQRVAGAWVGTLAVVLLVFVRWSAGSYVLLTGIPLVDLARIARYDPLVPVCALAALHVYLSARCASTRTVSAVEPAAAGQSSAGDLPVAGDRLSMGEPRTLGDRLSIGDPRTLGDRRSAGPRRPRVGGVTEPASTASAAGARSASGGMPLRGAGVAVVPGSPGRATVAPRSNQGDARRWPAGWRYGLAGALAGLAGLAHVYGLFCLVALAVLVAWDLRPRRLAVAALGWLVCGAVLVWLPYAAYVLSDLPDWRGQTLDYADRFELLDPRWFLSNALGEIHRYRPALGPFGLAWLARPGTWLMMLGAPLALAWLGRRALNQRPVGARAVFVPAVLFPLLFALLITSKVVNYTLLELPVIALALAWAIVALYRAAAHTAWARGLVALGLLAVVLEGGLRLVDLERAAQTTTPYATFIGQVRGLVPPGARVLGLHTYWFGMEAFDYRSFLMPLYLADAGLPLDEALDRVAPDVVVLDPRVREYFDAPATAPDRARFERWLADHAARLLGQVDDPTYGLVEVYAVARSTAFSAARRP